MIESLRDFLDRGDHPDDPAVRIDAVDWSDGDVLLDVAVTDASNHATWGRWTITCHRVRGISLGERFGPLVFHDARHPCVRQYRDRSCALYFRGTPRNPDAVIGRLWNAHRDVTGAWIPFTAYLNPSFTLPALLSAGAGKLADGPRFLMDAYATALPVDSMGFSLVDWPVRDPPPSLSMISIDDSFVVAEDFEDERTDGH